MGLYLALITRGKRRISGLYKASLAKGGCIKTMMLLSRIIRYGRIAWKGRSLSKAQSPPILVLFINSICNLKCEHCVYWRNLNSKDDLTVEEILSLARDLGRLEILALSGFLTIIGIFLIFLSYLKYRKDMEMLSRDIYPILFSSEPKPDMPTPPPPVISKK